MNVLITGAGGFLGQRLVLELLKAGQIKLDDAYHRVDAISAFDQTLPANFVERFATVRGSVQLHTFEGSIGDLSTVNELFQQPVDVVVHLAAVVSGTAEKNFDLGMTVNLDGTRYLLEACRRQQAHGGPRARVLFTSSVAVFGGAMPAVLTDETTPNAQGSYGIQKYIGEQLVQDYSRKGFIDGRSVRVPTVVVRPGEPNGAASGFASGIIREPLAGKDAVLPVPESCAMWMASPTAVLRMFLHALDLPEQAWGLQRSLNLPGLSVKIGDAIGALREIAGERVVSRIHAKPDPLVEKLVQSWPAAFQCERAMKMGFHADQDIAQIIRDYIAENPAAVVR